MFSKAIRKASLPLLSVGLLTATPVHAVFSEGYQFLDAVKKKDGEKVEKALSDSEQIINAKDAASGETALHIVTQRRDATWLAFMLAKGANANATDDRGRTALEIAANLGWRDGVEVLLASGASPNVVNDAGETPLIFAVHRKDSQMVKQLLEAGANPDRADNSGRTARDYARIEGAGSTLLTTIDSYAKKAPAKPKAVYGPSL